MKNKLRRAAVSFALCAAICGMTAFAACDKDTGGGQSDHHVHNVQSWVTTQEADCVKEQIEEGVCTVCGETVTRTSPALGHEWIAGRPISFPDCENDGEREAKCERCGLDGTVTTPALGHQWEWGEVLEVGSCTVGAKQKRHCTRTSCGKEETVENEPIGHHWEMYYTIDVEPTFDSEGERSVHCSVCGEKDKKEKIDKLEAGKPIDYEFRLVRTNGDLIELAGVEFSVKDGSGATVLSQGTFSKGKFSSPLEPAEYTVTVTKLPAGYTSSTDTFTVRPGNPVCNIELRGALLSTPATAETKYTVGSVVNDFEYTTLATAKQPSEKITLSGLLAEKKIVVLNFWYADCQFCQYEFPGMETAYRRYSDDVAIVAIDCNANANDSESRVVDAANGFGLSFYIVRDLTTNYLSRYGCTGYPATVIIDGEGVASYIHDGALVSASDYSDEAYVEAQFTALFERYTNPPYWNPPQAAAAALPVKRENY